MLYRLRWIFIVCLLSILPVGSMAQTLSASDYRPTTHSINVAFYNLPGKDIITEVSISVWNEVAAALHQPFNLVKAASQAQALQWLKTKKVRLVLGPLTLQNQQPGVWYVNSYVENADGVIIPTRLQIDLWKTIKDYF